jgi:ABC-type glycerol-3-phosphate transport system substrate-binding protein
MRALIITVAVFLAACGGETPDSTAESWKATLQLTGEKWLANSVPAHFVHSTCASAQKALAKAAKKVGERDPIRRRLEALTAAASKLERAVAAGDRRMAAEVVEELRR